MKKNHNLIKIFFIICISILLIPPPIKAITNNTIILTIGCSEECNDLAPLIRMIKFGLIPLFQIGVPIILIIMGMLDFSKAMIAGKEDEIKKHQSIFIKRCIYAITMFLVVTIVTVVFKLFDMSEANEEIKGTNDWITCYNAVGLTEKDNKCEN